MSKVNTCRLNWMFGFASSVSSEGRYSSREKKLSETPSIHDKNLDLYKNQYIIISSTKFVFT